jgi:TusA-related sulfurtransferase
MLEVRRNGFSNRRIIPGLQPMPGMISRDGKKGEKRSSQPEPIAEHVLDLRGMIIPLTLLKITQGFRKIEAGETMEILGTDPDTRRDFLKVLGIWPCKVMCNRNENDHYLIRLRKGRENAGGKDGEGSVGPGFSGSRS